MPLSLPVRSFLPPTIYITRFVSTILLASTITTSTLTSSGSITTTRTLRILTTSNSTNPSKLQNTLHPSLKITEAATENSRSIRSRQGERTRRERRATRKPTGSATKTTQSPLVRSSLRVWWADTCYPKTRKPIKRIRETEGLRREKRKVLAFPITLPRAYVRPLSTKPSSSQSYATTWRVCASRHKKSKEYTLRTSWQHSKPRGGRRPRYKREWRERWRKPRTPSLCWTESNPVRLQEWRQTFSDQPTNQSTFLDAIAYTQHSAITYQSTENTTNKSTL